MAMFEADNINIESYRHLERYEDNFKKISHIVTNKLYGQESDEHVFISVIIPTYRRQKYLYNALQSVLMQKTSFSFEIIVVDNTPLDELDRTPALDLIRELADSRIQYYHNAVNIGSGYNWNRGVELARGKWISFLHDDDVLLEDALTNIKSVIDRFGDYSKTLGYIQARMKKFQGDDFEIRDKYLKLPALELTQFTTLLLGHTHTGMPTCGTTILRKAYIEAGGINYDYGLTADAVLGYRIMRDYTVIRSPYILGGYRWGENESSKVETARKLIHSDFLFARYCYRKNFVGKAFGRFFWKLQYYKNVEQKMESVGKCKVMMGGKSRLLYNMFVAWVKFVMLLKGIIKFGFFCG